MTYSSTPELIATCWTSAGNIAPLTSPEISPVPIVERLEAIASTGWAGFGLAYDDLVAARDTIGFSGLKTLIDQAGFRHVEVELLTNWWDDSLSHEWRPQFELLLDAAETLGARFIKIGTAFGEPLEDLDFLVEPLRRLAKEASERGTRVALEPMPFSMVGSIPAAAELMRSVDMPECGLVVDYWHVFRAGTSLEELSRSVTAEQIFGVELNDADAEIKGTLFEDTRDNRRLCGEGDQDVAGFITTLQAIGFNGPWGVEILSEQHRTRPVREALESARSTALACFPPSVP
ncbi:sugar phosphate isomerase/epimerase family protein [Arthrobacter bambusae]|jgi:sugar phosphate isomerase/epimerase|uniref:sugar phosphate isomerase/epimerase family protein n=1 Tax=Arthrobacter bambusae TaxID=1338426 RepID=UPI002782B56C|nr:sugar phosphate isomerase/epimerase family protein [Arthrobacter bambusae]MDQ0213205.1 sugar phosphate isomerase/epimerase [Arthrobacter bambusae]MDQ0237511.1 sugar phosphate isomerase/epimerase [Arthrobacter bambusae]